MNRFLMCAYFFVWIHRFLITLDAIDIISLVFRNLWLYTNVISFQEKFVKTKDILLIRYISQQLATTAYKKICESVLSQFY